MTRAAAAPKTAIIVPDTHAPRQHRQSLRLVCKVAAKLRAAGRLHEIIQLGDTTDQACTGRWADDPRKVATFCQEIDETNLMLDQIDAAAGGAARTVTFGNHDERLESYLISNAPALLGLPGLTLAELLRLPERGWEWTPYKKGIHRGRLFLTHDVGRCGRRAHEQAVEDLGHSYAGGHTHNLAVTYRGTIFGEARIGASLGWLGDVRHIGYRHAERAKREYQLGFGILHWYDRGPRAGMFSLQPVPIVLNAKEAVCCVDGEWYSERPRRDDYWTAR